MFGKSSANHIANFPPKIQMLPLGLCRFTRPPSIREPVSLILASPSRQQIVKDFIQNQSEQFSCLTCLFVPPLPPRSALAQSLSLISLQLQTITPSWSVIPIRAEPRRVPMDGTHPPHTSHHIHRSPTIIQPSPTAPSAAPLPPRRPARPSLLSATTPLSSCQGW